MKRILPGIWLLLATAGLAGAGPLEVGLAADQKDDYSEAANLYRLAGEQGYAFAQFNLSDMCAKGKGVISKGVCHNG